MAKVQQNIWTYVIIALIVGFVIGYATAGGFAKTGKAFGAGSSDPCASLVKSCSTGLDCPSTKLQIPGGQWVDCTSQSCAQYKCAYSSGGGAAD